MDKEHVMNRIEQYREIGLRDVDGWTVTMLKYSAFAGDVEKLIHEEVHPSTPPGNVSSTMMSNAGFGGSVAAFAGAALAGGTSMSILARQQSRAARAQAPRFFNPEECSFIMRRDKEVHYYIGIDRFLYVIKSMQLEKQFDYAIDRWLLENL